MYLSKSLYLILIIIFKIYLSECIINGLDASYEQFPWHAYLIIKTNYKSRTCSGTLLSHYWIITAAHCLKRNPIYIRVQLGSIRRRLRDRDNYSAFKYFQHPQYEKRISVSKIADIGLIKVKKFIRFSLFIHPISLPTFSYKNKTKISRTCGFGVINADRKKYAAILQWTFLYILPGNKCSKYYNTLRASDIFCTLGYYNKIRPEISPCVGDSGSGLITNNNNTSLLVGVLSLVNKNCSKHPAIFIDLRKYLNWIYEMILTN